MALTSPDNIWTPDSSDNYALTTDLAATADSIQDAITALRGNNAPTVRVANVAERTTALADHGTPTSSNPLIVFRADAGAGREIEYTTNGTTWRSLVAEEDTGWVNVPTASNTSGTFIARKLGDLVSIKANVSVTISANTTTTIATVPAQFRDVSTRQMSSQWTSGELNYGDITSAGVVRVRRSQSATATGLVMNTSYLI